MALTAELRRRVTRRGRVVPASDEEARRVVGRRSPGIAASGRGGKLGCGALEGACAGSAPDLADGLLGTGHGVLVVAGGAFNEGTGCCGGCAVNDRSGNARRCETHGVSVSSNETDLGGAVAPIDGAVCRIDNAVPVVAAASVSRVHGVIVLQPFWVGGQPCWRSKAASVRFQRVTGHTGYRHRTVMASQANCRLEQWVGVRGAARGEREAVGRGWRGECADWRCVSLGDKLPAPECHETRT